MTEKMHFFNIEAVKHSFKKLTIHNYAKFFKRMLDSLNIEKVHLFGHCVGAVAAIEFAYLYPEKVTKLILVSVPYMGGMPVQAFYSFLAGMSERAPAFMKPVFFFWRSRLLTVPLDFF